MTLDPPPHTLGVIHIGLPESRLEMPILPLNGELLHREGNEDGKQQNHTPCGLALGFGLVQSHGGANERLQRLFIDLVALTDIDGASGVAFETGVEEA
jgi:hypothetical protein